MLSADCGSPSNHFSTCILLICLCALAARKGSRGSGELAAPTTSRLAREISIKSVRRHATDRARSALRQYQFLLLLLPLCESARPALPHFHRRAPPVLALRLSHTAADLGGRCTRPTRLSTPPRTAAAGPASLLNFIMMPSCTVGQENLGLDKSLDSGFAADDESWRTQRKKLNDVELQPNVRKRVMKDLRQLKAAEAEAEAGTRTSALRSRTASA